MPASLRDEVGLFLRDFADDLGDRAVFEEDSHGWNITPRNPKASPVWVAGDADDLWDLTVGFGRSAGRIELLFTRKVAPEAAFGDLKEICDAVVAGRLREDRKNERRCRWQLMLSDGTALRGSTNWLLPVLPWTKVTQEEFEAYT